MMLTNRRCKQLLPLTIVALVAVSLLFSACGLVKPDGNQHFNGAEQLFERLQQQSGGDAG